ncbi:scavenger receptor class F member 1-like [Haliotis rubra]|uniref:scavenger receptor class F member 1-like n=1 Tax=Haliotis rubra TaxID=36100 RepID=UPI001EE61271|nr:scavenger receptor class F member 1-like [Haliotis rubra]
MKVYFAAVCSVVAVVAVAIACSDGRYGQHCQSECGHCKGNLPCNKISGTCDQGCQPGFQEAFCKGCVDGMYGVDCMCKDPLTFDDESSGECPQGCQSDFMKPQCPECPECPAAPGRPPTFDNESSGECPEGCQSNFMKPQCPECPAAPGRSNWELPVTATLGANLVFALIALLTAIIYNRRLKKQLVALQKKSENDYMSLDEATRDPVVEIIYENTDNTVL